MRPLAQAKIMRAMTRPASSSKLMLLEDRRGGTATPGSARVRRYRLARLRLEGRPAGSQKRFDYLKRSYD
jgi:hypothetical protein